MKCSRPWCRRPAGDGYVQCDYHRDKGRRHMREHIDRDPEAHAAYKQAYEDTYRWRRQRLDRQRNAAIREQVFDYYGHECACCGATEDLTLDHVAGNGKAHRLELSGSPTAAGAAFYKWLIANGFPEVPGGLQVLCYPCNNSKKNSPACRLHR